MAALHPQPPVPSIVRKLPTPGSGARCASVLDCAEPTTFTSVNTVGRAASGAADIVAPAPTSRRRPARTGALQGPDDRQPRNARQAAARSGPVAAPGAGWRSCGRVRPRAHAVAARSRTEKAGRRAASETLAASQHRSSRHVPAAVRRRVWKRDQGQCAFVGDSRRCTERGFLEFHHVVPFADGGPTTAENLQLRCRAHNVYEAEQHFGPLFVREEQCAYNSLRNERVSMRPPRTGAILTAVQLGRITWPLGFGG